MGTDWPTDWQNIRISDCELIYLFWTYVTTKYILGSGKEIRLYITIDPPYIPQTNKEVKFQNNLLCAIASYCELPQLRWWTSGSKLRSPSSLKTVMRGLGRRTVGLIGGHLESSGSPNSCSTISMPM